MVVKKMLFLGWPTLKKDLNSSFFGYYIKIKKIFYSKFINSIYVTDEASDQCGYFEEVILVAVLGVKREEVNIDILFLDWEVVIEFNSRLIQYARLKKPVTFICDYQLQVGLGPSAGKRKSKRKSSHLLYSSGRVPPPPPSPLPFRHLVITRFSLFGTLISMLCTSLLQVLPVSN